MDTSAWMCTDVGGERQRRRSGGATCRGARTGGRGADDTRVREAFWGGASQLVRDELRIGEVRLARRDAVAARPGAEVHRHVVPRGDHAPDVVLADGAWACGASRGAVAIPTQYLDSTSFSVFGVLCLKTHAGRVNAGKFIPGCCGAMSDLCWRKESIKSLI